MLKQERLLLTLEIKEHSTGPHLHFELWKTEPPLILSHFLILIKMLKHSLLKLVAFITKHQIYKWANNPEVTQKNQLKKLIKKGSKTVFEEITNQLN